MSLWNKILLFLIGFATLGFLHAAARTMKTYEFWAKKKDRFEKKLEAVHAEVVSLQKADREHPRPDKSVGTEQLRADLRRVLTNRGRIWERCEKQKVTPMAGKEGFVQVTINTAALGANAFTMKMLLYVFEEGSDQSAGDYLGEFRVSAVTEKQIELINTSSMSVRELSQVQASRAPWVFYEMMPDDQHEIFADMPDDRKKTWLPKASSAEYLNDGQPLTANQLKQLPKGNGATTYERPLRDYLAIFRACAMHRTLFNDKYESMRRDVAYLRAANQDAQEQLQFAERSNIAIKTDRDWEKKQYNAVVGQLSNLQAMFSNNEQAVRAELAKALELAQEIAKLQKEAADRIDQRSRGSMAQSGSLTN